MTNQTIDDVRRELLEVFAGPRNSTPEQLRKAMDELRALLEAPSTEPSIPQNFVEACDKFDWTPEEALRFYADGKHFDTAHGRTRILCTGAIASHALKGMGESYAQMKGVEPTDQAQGEPVEPFGYWLQPKGLPLHGMFHRVTENDKVIYEPANTLERFDAIALYAEQPAPVAEQLIERLAQRFPDLENMYTAEVFADWLRAELNPSL